MTTNNANVQWVITGASQGFGRALTSEVLSRGAEVLAVVRNAASLDDLVAIHSPRLRVVTADLRHPDQVARVSDAIATAFGTPDVLVNNAGRAIVGAAEELTMDQLREQLELNFFTCAALTRSVVPGMRARGSGTIVQMSSQGGRVSYPGVGAYSASKFALEGWSEALAAEMEPFGVRVMIVEPSRFRTGFNTTHSLALTPEHGAYDEVVGPVRADLAGADGRQEGDPERAAAIIADFAAADEVPLRLPLGAEAAERISRSHRVGLAGVERLAELARSADFPGVAPSERAV